MWDRTALCGTEQSNVGQSSLRWDKVVWCGTKQSHVGQNSLMWDWPFSCETDETQSFKSLASPGISCKLVSKSLLDYQKVQIIFQKFWNVLQAWKYFSMISKCHLDCLKVKITFLKFDKSPGTSCKLQNMFVWFLKVPWIAWRLKIIFLKFYKS